MVRIIVFAIILIFSLGNEKVNSSSVPVCYVDKNNNGAIDSSNEVIECVKRYECPISNLPCDSSGYCHLTDWRPEGSCEIELNGAIRSYRTVIAQGLPEEKAIKITIVEEKYIGSDNHHVEIVPFDGNEHKVSAYGTDAIVKKPDYSNKKITIYAKFHDKNLEGSCTISLTSKKISYSCTTYWECPGYKDYLCVDPNDSQNSEITEVNEQEPKDDGPKDEYGNCLGQIYIFNGRTSVCRRSGIETIFHNCCTICAKDERFQEIKDNITAALETDGVVDIDAGWDISLFGVINISIDYCDDRDILTSCFKELGLCHKVGEFCKRKIYKWCVQKAETYCCFSSKLARIIHEQGRPQLKSFQNVKGGIWGTPTNPYCRGFTPEEFQMLDFSRMNLSEWYNEIKQKAQNMPSDVEKKFEQKLPDIKSKFQNF